MNRFISLLKNIMGFYTQEKRSLTFMVVPHSGHLVRQIKIPVLYLKMSCSILLLIALITGVTISQYAKVIETAHDQRQELNELRTVNQSQNQEVKELQRMTAVIQTHMDSLNILDQEVRRKAGLEQQSGTSRFDNERLIQEYQGGQGGPAMLLTTRALRNHLQQLQDEMDQREQSLHAVLGYLQQQEELAAVTPSIWPADGQVTSPFGYRQSPFGSRSEFHPGLDIANGWGTPIMATADGKVQFSGWVSGYGNFVEIQHANGIVTCYGHNSVNLVTIGQQVQKGQIIAKMGSTGYSTGAHVHYEVRINGSPVNPVKYLP